MRYIQEREIEEMITTTYGESVLKQYVEYLVGNQKELENRIKKLEKKEVEHK